MERWRGLKDLVQDAVDHGSRAVERLQKEAAKRPFDLLEKIPQIALPVKGIREIHDASVSSVHGVIRLVNRVAGDTVDVVLARLAQGRAQAEPPADAAGQGGETPSLRRTST
jgi:hypothetical protein